MSLRRAVNTMSTLINRRPPSPPLTVQSEDAEIEMEIVSAGEMNKYVVPEFTVKDLLDCIPKHCFERSAIRSSLYLAWDILLLALLTLGINSLSSLISTSPALSPPYLRATANFIAWNIYWFTAGLVATGVWVIAHECGHQAYSESKTINNTVGFILHSALGVPYHSWRISHGKHHAATGHLTRDQVFVPVTRSQSKLPAFDENREDKEGKWVSEEVRRELEEALGESPAFAAISLVVQQTCGWFAYVLFNVSGQRTYPLGTNHYNPKSVIFEPRHWAQIVQSDIGVVAWLVGLGMWGYVRGFGEVARYYLPLYLYVNNWLVLITFLQHTDPLLPHYRASTWSFPRGALCTIDRTFLGPIGAYVLHGIAETHVAHHVNYKIPHYNAWEATRALKERLGESYFESRENMVVSLWKVWRECKFVEDDGGVVFYKNKDGLARSVAVFQKDGKDGAFSDSGVEVQ